MATYQAKVEDDGDGLVILLPRQVAEHLRLSHGDFVELVERGGEYVLLQRPG